MRELFGVMAAKGAAGGFVVTSGTFTRRRGRFCQWPQCHSDRRPKAARDDPDRAGPERTSCRDGAAERCGGTGCRVPYVPVPMVLRQGKKGTLAGRRFWGCSRYPSCRGTEH